MDAEPQRGQRRRGEKSALTLLSGILLLAWLFTGCAPKRSVITGGRVSPSPPPKEAPQKDLQREAHERVEKRETKVVQYGVASWYGPDFHGKATSSGEIYDMYQLTCAHNTFALGTMVMVTNLENNNSVELKVNDRGPFVKDRIIDVSYTAAQILGMWEKGTASVRVEGLGSLIDPNQRFSVQVGSFTDQDKAQRLADQLRSSFEDVYVAAVETSTQKYHRVRVGAFDTRELAWTTAEKLSQMGFQVLVTNR
jgi:rare lipoprotein A